MKTVYTIGHSTREFTDFVSLLREHGIEVLADVRSIPRSRHNPQYEQTTLQEVLPKEGVEYLWLKNLGGRRHTLKNSPNMGWRNESFRGYADYMQTPEFADAVAELIELASKKRVAIMCAEAVPWRCHRSLVGDALLVRGVEVQDIMAPGKATPHTLTKFAKVVGTTLTYPPAQETLL